MINRQALVRRNGKTMKMTSILVEVLKHSASHYKLPHFSAIEIQNYVKRI